jgi:hypothetical protein
LVDEELRNVVAQRETADMDFYWQKARLFAVETAKKSQDIASQAAKLSQDLATETAKRSKELATETAKISKELATETAKRSKELALDVSKKADQLKTYAGDQLKIPSNAASKGPGGIPPPPSDEELEEYGITPALREFVKGLTIKTFMDFPVDGPDGKFQTPSASPQCS